MWQTLGSGCGKKPFKRGHWLLQPLGGSRKVWWIISNGSALSGLTKFQPAATVDIEGLIARLHLSVKEGVEDKAIWAQPLLWYVADTFVIFVALNWVGKEALPLRTFEL